MDRVVVMLLFSSLALGSRGVSTSAVLTEGRLVAEARAGGTLGPVRGGVLVQRGVHPRTTRIDGFVGLSPRLGPIRPTLGVQIGGLIHDPRCRQNCRAWAAYESKPPVGFVKGVVGLGIEPTEATEIELHGSTFSWPRWVRWEPAEEAGPAWVYPLSAALMSSAHLQQHLTWFGRAELRLHVDLRAPSLMLNPRPDPLPSAFGPRAGAGLSLNLHVPLPAAVELNGGASIGGPFVQASLRFGGHRENLIW